MKTTISKLNYYTIFNQHNEFVYNNRGVYTTSTVQHKSSTNNKLNGMDKVLDKMNELLQKSIIHLKYRISECKQKQIHPDAHQSTIIKYKDRIQKLKKTKLRIVNIKSSVEMREIDHRGLSDADIASIQAMSRNVAVLLDKITLNTLHETLADQLGISKSGLSSRRGAATRYINRIYRMDNISFSLNLNDWTQQHIDTAIPFLTNMYDICLEAIDNPGNYIDKYDIPIMAKYTNTPNPNG